MEIRWQSSEAWFIAPEGYEIDNVVNGEGVKASTFEEEYAYAPDDTIVGFRWRFNNGMVRDALVPEDGTSYEWSTYPYSWVAVDNKFGYQAIKYTPSANYMVWVYAPVHLKTATIYNLIITIGTGGTTNPQPATYPLVEGTQQQVTAIPSENYTFTKWQLDGADRMENPITVSMDGNHMLNAVFTYTSQPPPPPPPPETNKIVPVIVTVGAIAVGVYLLWRYI